jgi:hypothetical protein
MPDLSFQFGSQQTRRQTRSRDFKALLRGLDLLFQCMGLGTLSLHAQLPLWRERKSLSVTDSYRGRSGDEEKVNVLSANVGALVHTARHKDTPGPGSSLAPIQERDAVRAEFALDDLSPLRYRQQSSFNCHRLTTVAGHYPSAANT